MMKWPIDTIIPITDQIYLGRFGQEDWRPLVDYLNDDEIERNTLLRPIPYTREAAEDWIENARKGSILKGGGGNLGIYFKGIGLIGGIGYSGNTDRKFKHQAEIGYWLARPFRGNGHMEIIIRAFSNWIFENTPYKKITASTFVHNSVSGHILEKCGFQMEGTLRRHMKKGDEYMDCMVYGLLKEDLNQ